MNKIWAKKHIQNDFGIRGSTWVYKRVDNGGILRYCINEYKLLNRPNAQILFTEIIGEYLYQFFGLKLD